MSISRRTVIASGAAAALLAAPAVRTQASAPRIVVIGGGFAGATCAKYLRTFAPTLDVTLVEPAASVVLCPMSNRVLRGDIGIRDITKTYDAFIRRHGIRWVRAEVSAIDAERREIRAGSENLRYDRLVVAPGVDFRYGAIAGMESPAARSTILHAWKAGEQTLKLRQQLREMRPGGVFVLSIPKVPFRCPPGPYERASLVADYLAQANPRAKVLVLDANPSIQSKRELFETVWRTRFPRSLEYVADAEAEAVDAASLKLRLRIGSPVKGDVVNLIPPQAAGTIASRAGLVRNGAQWCEVDFRSYASKLLPAIHVIGDSIQGSPGMPKSAHMANGEAKVCAMAIAADLGGATTTPEPILANACYSFVSSQEAMHVAHVFRLDAASGRMIPAPNAGGVSAAASRVEAIYAMGWAYNIMEDSFG